MVFRIFCQGPEYWGFAIGVVFLWISAGWGPTVGVVGVVARILMFSLVGMVT
jgi:hypothetical protein